MRLLKIRTSNGIEELPIPEDVSEITFKQWNEYQKVRDQVPEWVTEFDKISDQGKAQELASEWDSTKMAEYIWNCCDLLAAISGYDFQQITGLPLHDFDEQSLSGMFNLYFYYRKLIFSYQPKSIGQFAHRGELYRLASETIKTAGVVEMSPNMTVIETVQALQFRQIIGGMTTPKRDVHFQCEIGVVASLARRQIGGTKKKDEGLPKNLAEWRIRMSNRMKLFEDLPLDTVLDIRFFLTSTSSGLQNILNSQLRSGLLQLQSKMAKLQEHSKKGRRRSGDG